jgi:Fuc2NAc and GlcNAc transferase
MFQSWMITAWVHKFALRNSIIDHPNPRSLHVEATPRGGGLSVAILLLLGIVILFRFHLLSAEVSIAAFIGGSMVAIIGWLDDKSGFPTVLRAFFYILASIWAVYWILGSSKFSIIDDFILSFCLILGIAWLINLYNFMDGSDGLAAIQAISAGIMGAVYLFDVNESGLALFTLLLVAANTGFLLWNWPPARIFMGDVGSCLLGFVFGVIIVDTFINETLSLSVWLILLSIFICDASLTLTARFLSGKQWYRAHREHAYQRFIQMNKSHKQLLFYIILINTIFLYPMSYLAYIFPEYNWWICIGVYSLLTGIWIVIQIKYKNYQPDNNPYV